MTQPPDPQIADSIGNGVFLVLLVGLNVWTRFKSNKKLAVKIDDSLHTRVASLEASLKTTQELVAIYTENVKESNVLSKDLKAGMAAHQRGMDAHREEMHAFAGTIEKGEVLAGQINDYLDRAKSGKLQTEPTVTGNVTFKEEKRKP